MIKAGKIIILKRVRGDWPIGHHLVAEPGVYIPEINRYGAVSVGLEGGSLGLKPDEFEWLEKPPKEVYERQ